MNDEELEARLQALAPAEPPSALRERLASPPAERPRLGWLRWTAPLAAAAAVAFALVLHRWVPAPRAQPSSRELLPSDFHVFLPVEDHRTLFEIGDLSIIAADSENLVRLVRCTWIDDITYRGDDGAILHRSEAREQIDGRRNEIQHIRYAERHRQGDHHDPGGRQNRDAGDQSRPRHEGRYSNR